MSGYIATPTKLDQPTIKLNKTNLTDWSKEITRTMDAMNYTHIVNWMTNRLGKSERDELGFKTPSGTPPGNAERIPTTSIFRFTEVPRPSYPIPTMDDVDKVFTDTGLREKILYDKMREAELRKRVFERDIGYLWGWIVSSVEPSLFQEVENKKPQYHIAKEDYDLRWLWVKLEEAASGTAEQAASKALMSLMQVKMNDNFTDYSHKWLEQQQKLFDLENRGIMTWKDLFLQVLATLFIRNIIDGDLPVLQAEINRILAKPQLPPPEEVIREFSQIINARERIAKMQEGEGRVTANAAKVKAKKPCLRCGDTKHGHWDCKEKVTCDTCGKGHATKNHELATEIDSRYAAREKKKKGKSEATAMNATETAATVAKEASKDDYWTEESLSAYHTKIVNTNSHNVTSYLVMEQGPDDPNDPRKPSIKLAGDMQMGFDPDSETNSEESDGSRQRRIRRNKQRKLRRDAYAGRGLPEPGRVYRDGFQPDPTLVVSVERTRRLNELMGRQNGMVSEQDIERIITDLNDTPTVRADASIPPSTNRFGSLRDDDEDHDDAGAIKEDERKQSANETSEDHSHDIPDLADHDSEDDEDTKRSADTDEYIRVPKETYKAMKNLMKPRPMYGMKESKETWVKHMHQVKDDLKYNINSRFYREPTWTDEKYEEEIKEAMDRAEWKEKICYLPILSYDRKLITWKRCTGCSHEEQLISLMNLDVNDLKDKKAILDTGSSGHVIRSKEGLSHITPSIGRSVVGISGNGIRITHTANHPLLGHVYIVPDAAADLVSIPKLLSKGMKVEATVNKMTITDKEGRIFLTGNKRHDGLFEANLEEIHSYMLKASADPINPKFNEDRDDEDYYQEKRTNGRHNEIPLNQHERARAHEARDLHIRMGHPGDEAQENMVNHGLIPGINLTSKDFENADRLLGRCTSCILGKMQAPTEETRLDEDLNMKVGEIIYVDLQQPRGKGPSLGGNTQMLLARDRRSALIMSVAMKNKTKESIANACMQLVSYMKSCGHTTRLFVFDSEPTLLATKPLLEKEGLQCRYTPAGLHNKVIERATLDVKRRMRCMENDLLYQLPDILYFELMNAAITCINSVPNDMTGPTMTPYQLVTGVRPAAKAYKFGQTGVCYSPRKDTPEQRAEWCIMIDHVADTPGNYRVYIPTRQDMYSRRKFVAHDTYPPEWGFRPRIQIMSNRPIPSVQPMDASEISVPLNTMTPTIPYSTGKVMMGPPEMFLPPRQEQATVPDKVITTPVKEATTENSKSDSNEKTPTKEITEVPPPKPPEDITAPTVELRRTTRTNAGKNPRLHSMLLTEDDDDGIYTEAYEEVISMMSKVNEEEVANDTIRTVTSFRISLRDALTQGSERRQQLSWIAMEEELHSLMHMKVFKFIKENEIPSNHRTRIVPCHMFMKEKYNADGSYQKMKARLVASGNFVDQSLIGDTKAPTARSISVMSLLNRAAIQGDPIGTGDITSAFLVPDIDQNIEEDVQYVRFPKAITTQLVRLYPELQQFVNSKGELIARLLKWLYGLPQSAERFATHLSQTLVGKLGYTPFTGDKCMFKKNRMLVVAHVDDLLFTGPTKEMDEFKRQIRRQYNINIQDGDKHSYLGLNIQRGRVRDDPNPAIRVSQNGYIKELVNKYATTVNKYISPGRIPETPTNGQFCSKSPEGADKVSIRDYAGMVMSLMFLARFTRPDILFGCSVLSTWCSDPDIEHMKKACRVFKYAATSGDIGVTFRKKPVKCIMGADAGHHIHADAKGHGGHTCSLGSGVIFTRSYKMKMTTLSSTETEFAVASDAVKVAMYVNNLCEFMEIPVKPTTLIQDNTSAIWLSGNDGNFARNAHLLARRNFVKEGILEGEIVIKYVNTAEMYPDLLTKPGHRPEEIKRHLSAMGMTIKTPVAGSSGPVWNVDDSRIVENDNESEDNVTDGAQNTTETAPQTDRPTSVARRRTQSEHNRRSGKGVAARR